MDNPTSTAKQLESAVRASKLFKRAKGLVTNGSPVWRVLRYVCCLLWLWSLWLLKRALRLYNVAYGAGTQKDLQNEILRLANQAKRESRRSLIVDGVAAAVVLAYVLFTPWARTLLVEAVTSVLESLVVSIPTVIFSPTLTPTKPATRTSSATHTLMEAVNTSVGTTISMTIVFTITCADLRTHTVQAGDPITLSIFSVVFIEPNLTPKGWDAARPQRLLKLSGEEKRFSYAATDFERDIVTFQFVASEKADEVTTRSLPIIIVPKQRGLCRP